MIRAGCTISVILLWLAVPVSAGGQVTAVESAVPSFEDPDQAARHLTRRVLAEFYTGNLLQVLRLTRQPEGHSASSLFHRGEVLRSLGLLREAADSYLETLAIAGEPDGYRSRALARYLAIYPILPGAPVPPAPPEADGALSGEGALAMGSHLLGLGEQQRGLALLSRAAREDGDTRILAVLSEASQVAALGDWDRSADRLAGFRFDRTSPLSDLVFLTRGYHHLENGNPSRASDAFQAVPPDSPYAADARLGNAWALIGQGDLSGAVIQLEELVRVHPEEPAVRSGILDLALCYRDLGLFEQAGEILDREAGRLEELANWAGSLREADFYPGQRLADLLDLLVNREAPPSELLATTPAHVKVWVQSAVRDPQVQRLSALLMGIETFEEVAGAADRRLAEALGRTRAETEWVDRDLGTLDVRTARLGELKERVAQLDQDMKRALSAHSLETFASQRASTVLSRIKGLQNRLEVMENTVEKAGGFSGLIEKLSGTFTGSDQEQQLNRIRENAYRGLVDSRSLLDARRSALRQLEGRLWLGLKSRALDLEVATTRRVNTAVDRIEGILTAADRSRSLLDQRRLRLAVLSSEIRQGQAALSGPLGTRLGELRTRTIEQRALRLIQIARDSALGYRESRARALYTAADIEITRMQRNLEALQESSP